VFKGNISEEQLKDLPKPPWNASKRRNKSIHVPHWSIMPTIRRELDEFKAGEVQIHLSRHQQHCLFAVEMLNHGGDLGPDTRMWFCVANANDSRRASRCYSGITWDGIPIILYRYQKDIHKATFDLSETIRKRLDLLALQAIDFPDKIGFLKKRRMEEEEIGNAIYQAMLRSIIPRNKAKSFERMRMKQDRMPLSGTVWSMLLAFGRMAVIESNSGERAKLVTNNPLTDIFEQLSAFKRLLTVGELPKPNPTGKRGPINPDCKLTPRERRDVVERYYEVKSLREVGREFSISHERVRQLVELAKRKRHEHGEDGKAVREAS
jgi:DNA-binding CsgD family transcriptional regulator